MTGIVPIQISQTTRELLRCPVCRGKLREVGQHLVCVVPQCGARFPVVDGIPILINEANSVFSMDDIIAHKTGIYANTRWDNLKTTLRRFIPSISANIKAGKNFDSFNKLLPKPARVLVVGGGILGHGMETLADNPSLEIIETDVLFSPQTALICDGHDLPFEDRSFDGVIVQAVLEHVVDPYRCVEEIYRVLNAHGLVYAETPFIQQVHLGRYDFTRFTHLGHRRLFRKFEEIDSGAMCGPGMALAWSYMYFLRSFAPSKPFRMFAEVFAAFTAFYLKYFDYYLINKPGALDAASGCYFLGKKSTQVLTDKELLSRYQGIG